MDWLDLLAVQGTLKSLVQHHSSKASILRCSAFFTVQLSHPCMTTGKTIALTRRTLVGKVMSLLLNILSRLLVSDKTPASNVCAMSLQLCPTFCDLRGGSPPGSSVHGILQARILEWVAMPSSGGSSPPRNQICVSHIFCIAGGFYTTEPLRKPLIYIHS